MERSDLHMRYIQVTYIEVKRRWLVMTYFLDSENIERKHLIYLYVLTAATKLRCISKLVMTYTLDSEKIGRKHSL